MMPPCEESKLMALAAKLAGGFAKPPASFAPAPLRSNRGILQLFPLLGYAGAGRIR
jgi:hypothetical protein